MWKSLGDKYDIVKHKNDKNPRRIKTNALLLVLMPSVVLLPSFTTLFINDAVNLYYVRLGVGVVVTLLLAIMLLVKYLRNNEEVDFLIISGIWIMVMYIFYLILFK